MGKLGTKVMAAGAKDVNFGAAWLKEAAATTGVTVLSANLTENGKRVFDGSTVITVGNVRVGFVAVTQPGGVVGTTTMVATPLVPAIKEELAKLRGKTDLVLLLAAVKQADSLELSSQFKSQIDFVITSSDSRGMQPAQKADGAWILGSGARGQAVASLTLKVDGKGPYVDLGEIAREKEVLVSLEERIAEVEPRLKATTDPEARKLLQETAAGFKARAAEQKKKVDAGVSADSRTFDFQFAMLNDKVVDDAALKTEVLVYEPTYAGSH